MTKFDICKGCELKVDTSNKSIIYKEIKDNVIKCFCNENCYNFWKEDNKFEDENYKILLKEKENLEIDINILKEEIESLKENLKDEYNKGYINGLDSYKQVLKIRNICPHCKNHIIESVHHIIPRKFNGNDDADNLIALCFKCHDKIEILTYELFISNKKYSQNELFGFIINDNFPNINSENTEENNSNNKLHNI
jgi:hypothetical protein